MDIAEVAVAVQSIVDAMETENLPEPSQQDFTFMQPAVPMVC